MARWAALVRTPGAGRAGRRRRRSGIGPTLKVARATPPRGGGAPILKVGHSADAERVPGPILKVRQCAAAEGVYAA